MDESTLDIYFMDSLLQIKKNSDFESALKEGVKYSNCKISSAIDITEDFLKQLRSLLEEDADVFIARLGKKIDMQKYGTMLVKCGYKNVVQMKKRAGKKAYVIHCSKGELVENPMLSVIVPLYNEENTAGELLKALIDRNWIMPVEFVLVESNSKDRTREIALSYKDRENVTVVLEDKPSGKGNGVLNGIKHAKGQFIAIQDGDLEYDVNDYDKLLPHLMNYETLFMLGSRYNAKDWKMRKFTDGKNWIADYLNVGQKLLTWTINTACGCKLTDPFTMYKLFHKDCIYGINFNGGNFGLDWELVIRFIRKGYKPIEIPIYYKARSYAEGKHIELFKTPIEGLKMLWKCRYVANVYDYGDE